MYQINEFGYPITIVPNFTLEDVENVTKLKFANSLIPAYWSPAAASPATLHPAPDSANAPSASTRTSLLLSPTTGEEPAPSTALSTSSSLANQAHKRQLLKKKAEKEGNRPS
jgi:hypothetical protein